MAKRKIIKIDEKKCNGCGLCIPNCPEGAIQMIDGKARLISDLFCDGLGACIGHCPEDAIKIEEREAEKYDEKKVMENIISQGKNVIKAHLKHLKEHGEEEYYKQAIEALKEKGLDHEEIEGGTSSGCIEGHHHGEGGCPGTRMMDLKKHVEMSDQGSSGEQAPRRSQLGQWPIQLQLLNPNASYFKDADIVIAADCVPFAYPDFHERFLKGKILIIFCPKLDQTMDQYLDKLEMIFKANNIRSITMVHMEVPCCFGLVGVVEEALKRSGKNIIIKEYTVSLNGELI